MTINDRLIAGFFFFVCFDIDIMYNQVQNFVIADGPFLKSYDVI